MNSYSVTQYTRQASGVTNGPAIIVMAASAQQAIEIALCQPFDDIAWQTKTSRWGRSPVEADRDNLHLQFNGAGTEGIYCARTEINEAEAQRRSDVAVARKWVSDGRSLSDLQKYGAYLSVTEADLHDA